MTLPPEIRRQAELAFMAMASGDPVKAGETAARCAQMVQDVQIAHCLEGARVSLSVEPWRV